MIGHNALALARAAMRIDWRETEGGVEGRGGGVGGGRMVSRAHSSSNSSLELDALFPDAAYRLRRFRSPYRSLISPPV